MTPLYSKIHNAFKINDCRYSFEELREVAYSHVKEGLPFEKRIGNFLIDWLDNKDHVLVKTSGSTGIPKLIKLKKQSMVNSAIATGNYFDLKPGNRALHCLPTNFIAGKMMLVRAMILGLELDITEPTSLPVFDYDRLYDFCAMVPLQLQNTISHCQKIKTIIVGGAPISIDLQEEIQHIKSKVFATYGMTETITHIAVKPINNVAIISTEMEKSHFITLPNIVINQDERGCLVIEASHLFENKVITNDIVKLHSDSEFEFLGRYDNVINSGGVKLFPEQIENKLSKVIKKRFFITSLVDKVLGDKVVLVIEDDSNNIPKSAFKALDKYEIPKEVFAISSFIETFSGKVHRHKTLSLILK